MVWPGSKEGLAGKDPVTGVDIEVLRGIGKASVATPIDFVREQLSLIIEQRLICWIDIGSTPATPAAHQA